MKIQTVDDAYQLLSKLDAPKRLVRHSELVLECADIILNTLDALDVKIDSNIVSIGAVLHDVGKVRHPEELNNSGKLHKLAGKKLLNECDVPEVIAEFCISHHDWKKTDSLESLTVSLADKLWKRKRNTDLERCYIERVANLLVKDFWNIFIVWDDVFELIAEDADKRLIRSQQ